MRFVLASSSPRRRELLARLDVEPDAIASPDIDESARKGELPRDYALRMAREKAAAVDCPDGTLLLAGDTVVAVGRRILGKARDDAEQRVFLSLMSGRRHRVLSAIALVQNGGEPRTRLSTSIVRFKRLTDAEIAGYIASGEGRGKAGGYAIQGSAEAFVAWMSGSHSGIMGLPLYETRSLLVGAGYLT